MLVLEEARISNRQLHDVLHRGGHVLRLLRQVFVLIAFLILDAFLDFGDGIVESVVQVLSLQADAKALHHTFKSCGKVVQLA